MLVFLLGYNHSLALSRNVIYAKMQIIEGLPRTPGDVRVAKR